MAFTKPIIQAPQCSACGSPMKLIPAGVSKTKVDDEGNPVKYGAFWSCPNNLKGCGGKTMKYTEPAPQAPQKPYNKLTEALIPVIKETESPQDAVLLERLDDISQKLDLIIKEIIPQE